MDLSHDHHRSRLLIPHLHSFYVFAGNLWYPMLRVTAGALLLPHGIPKLLRGVDSVAAGLARGDYPFEMLLAYLLIFLETAGAVFIMLGLFTRAFAAAAAIQMAIITFIAHAPEGWSGMEYPFLWGIVMLAIALHGGGPYSLDRKLGREL